jgi:hypothetical protein
LGFRRRVQIQADNLDAPLRKVQGHQFPNPTGTASYQDDLLAVDEFGIRFPVVDYILRELAIDEAGGVEPDEDLQPPEKPCG